MRSPLNVFSAGLLLLCSLVLFQSCKKGNRSENTPKLDRQVLKDVQEVFTTLDRLEKMNEEDLTQWEKDHHHKSFRTYVKSWDENHTVSKSEESLLALPTSYQVLLNQNGELQVGDTIVWYNCGKKYYVAASDEGLYETIKLNTSLAKKVGEYSVSAVTKYGTPYAAGPNLGLSHPEGAKVGQGNVATVNLGLSDLNATYQREFNQICPPAGGCRKWVHEILGVVDMWSPTLSPGCGNFYSFYVKVYLRIKMEWKNCRKNNWQPAGESRTITYSLNKNIRLRGVVPPCSTIESNLLTTGTQSDGPLVRTSNLDVILAGYAGNTWNSNVYWEVGLSGTIYQHVNCDDPNNAWNHVGNPFF